MTVEPFRNSDIPAFLSLAAAESWIAELWEFEFLLSTFPEGCFCVRDSAGKGIAFVTSLRHESSGWIGNLIVSSEYRGQKIGEKLFASTLDALRDSGVGTFWLTASKSGRSLYEKFGFHSIDTIIRWSGVGRQRHVLHGQDCPRELLAGIDSKGWGDCRHALLDVTAGRGRQMSYDSGFVVIQPTGSAWQLGPFSALDSGTAEQLLDDALRTVPVGMKVYSDVPASNRAALRMFNRKRMRISGSNELMYAGQKPEYRSEYVYGLATMGSCG
jgi:ribosomal protein S18 acetylase RimI-like enzyme